MEIRNIAQEHPTVLFPLMRHGTLCFIATSNSGGLERSQHLNKYSVKAEACEINETTWHCDITRPKTLYSHARLLSPASNGSP